MANLAVWLGTLVGPLAKRILVALGIGWVTYEGITTLVNTGVSAIQSQWGILGGTTAQMMALFGFGEGMGIVLGGITARAAVMALGHLGRVAT